MIANRKEVFNTEPLVSEIEHVIRNGLKQILNQYIDRYDLLEKTHQQIMRLPSVLNELNINPNTSHDMKDITPIVSKFDSSELSSINSKINIIEQKYESVSSTLDKILQKLETLNHEIKNVKENNDQQTKLIDLQCIKPSIVAACENENIQFEINDDSEEEEEYEDDDDKCSSDCKCDSECKCESDCKCGSTVVDSSSLIHEVKVDDEEDEKDEDEEEEVEEDEEDEVEEEVEVVVDNICSDCGCKVVSKEYITVVDGKNYCGACTPKEDDIETEESESDSESDKDKEEEEEELVEIEIDDITYCTNDEENGFIYELTKDGDVGDKVGYLKEGEPFFYSDEK